MATDTNKRPVLLQHKVRPEVKAWIEHEARVQERSQAWVLTKLVEDAFAASQTKSGEPSK